MTRQDGGTGPALAYHAPSHRGRPRAAVAPALALVGALFFLGACEGIMGGLLGGLGTAGVGYLGKTTAEDIATAAVWRSKHREIVNRMIDSIMVQCRNLEAADMKPAITCYRGVLQISEAQQPKILVERLADRARRAREGAGVESLITPKMVAPAD